MHKLITILFALGLLPVTAAFAADEKNPNIILIYADDLGYGDVSCYGARTFKTPHIDRLAEEGLRFTDGHSPSATCTPSRYAMLTGEYAWRQKGTGIARGDANLIIKPGRTTLPGVLKQAGYDTAVVGKWHLGLGEGKIDWNGDIRPGPLEIGFDYSFLIPATGDRVPCVYVENHRVVDHDPADPIEVSFGKKIGDQPSGKDNPELLKMKWAHGHNNTIVNGISRIGWMTGGEKARWVDEDMADVITHKATKWITDHKDAPFFLFFSTQDIHVPRVPHSRFAGKSGHGPRGDATIQLDWCVGQLLKTLDDNKLAVNTLVIFTSDNGPVLNDGYHDDAVEKVGAHKAAGNWRGGKYSNFEAGTRVPFIVRWPARVKAGSTSNTLVSQVDFVASLAALAGQKFDAATAPDTVNTLAALLGESKKGRDHLVEHAGNLSVRKGDWKFIEATRGKKAVKVFKNTNIESGRDNGPQLYNLAKDPGETRNLASENPDKLAELRELLKKVRANGK